MSTEKTSAGVNPADPVIVGRLDDDTSKILASPPEKAPQRDPLPVPTWLQTLSNWSWRAIVVTLFVAGFGWLFLRFSSILIALMVALLLAVIIEPLTSWLKKTWHWPPAAAAAAGLLTFFFVILLMLAGAGTGIVAGVANLSDQVQAGVQTLITMITDVFPDAQAQLQDAWADIQRVLQENSGRIVGGVASVSSSITGFITGAVICFFALFFYLKDGRRLWHWVVRLAPVEYQDRTNESGIRAWVTIGNYTRTQVIVAAVDAAGIGVVALLLKTPITLAFPIAVVVFLFSFIPMVGAFLSGFLAVLVVLVNTQSMWMALFMLLGVIVVQQVEGNLLQPILQGNALNMHPVAIILIVTAGSIAAGFVGAVFAVPIAAAINTVLLYLRGHDTYPYLDRLESRPGGPPKPFEQYRTEHWEQFDQEVANHLSPKELRAAKKQARAARREQKKKDKQSAE